MMIVVGTDSALGLTNVVEVTTSKLGGGTVPPALHGSGIFSAGNVSDIGGASHVL